MNFEDYIPFLDKLLNQIQEKGIDISNLNLDHFGYQCDSLETYNKVKPEFLKLGEMVHENTVRGRLVSIFKLHTPIKYKNYTISALELVEPLKDQVCPSDWEHCEFVLNESFEDFLKKYPNILFDTSAISQPGFPMLKLRLSEFTQVKFHLKPVLQIVEDENQADLKS
jgi:predicted metalloenzyme YecM